MEGIGETAAVPASAAPSSSAEMGGLRASKFVDTACQTEAMQVPLPINYPANLIYAQSMLAITLNQMHQLDLNIAQLRFHLCEHEVRAVAAAVLVGGASEKAVSSIAQTRDAGAVSSSLRTNTPPGESRAVAAGELPQDAAQQRGGAGGDAAADAGGAAARRAGPVPAAGAGPVPHAAAGAGQLPPRPADAEQPLRQHRRRLAAAVKIALMMILLEFKAGWFFLYFFAVFMYMGGLFDPFIEWFQRPAAQATLEQQLTALRNRQRRAGEQAAAAVAANTASDEASTPPTPAPAAAATSEAVAGEGGEVAASAGGTTEGQASREPGPAAAAAEPVADPGTAERTSRPAPPGGTTANGDADAVAEAQRPPWAHRFIYQLLVMFFMTLLPWWNPDPRYL